MSSSSDRSDGRDPVALLVDVPRQAPIGGEFSVRLGVPAGNDTTLARVVVAYDPKLIRPADATTASNGRLSVELRGPSVVGAAAADGESERHGYRRQQVAAYCAPYSFARYPVRAADAVKCADLGASLLVAIGFCFPSSTRTRIDFPDGRINEFRWCAGVLFCMLAAAS